MSDYTQNTYYTPKDALATGDADKLILGSEIDAELADISTAIATKADLSEVVVPADFNDLADTWVDQETGMVGQLNDLADPAADRLVFWDDSGGALQFLTLDPTTLAIAGQTMSALGTGGGSYGANQVIDHTTVAVTAGSGLTGGGNIDQTRTLNVGAGSGIAVAADSVAVSLTGLTAFTGGPASGDVALMYDLSAAANRKVQFQDIAIPIDTVSGTSKTFATADMNRVNYCTSGSATTLTLNTSVGAAGNILVIVQNGAGQVTVAGTATVSAATGKKTRAQYSVIVLLCVAANTWICYGDAAA